MIEQAVLFLALAVLGVRLLQATAAVVGSSLYDITQVRMRSQKTPHTTNPSISVVVVSRNHEEYIERCLNSVVHGAYKKCQITVVDSASSDTTKKVVKQMIKEYSHMDIKLIAKRKQVSFESAVATAKRYADGDLLLYLDGDSFLESNALESAVQQFRTYSSLRSVELNQRVLSSPSLFGLLQRFNYFGQFYFLKLLTVYRRSMHPSSEAAYASDAIVFIEPQLTSRAALLDTNKQPHQLYKLFFIAFEPFVVIYFFYIAYTLKDASLLTVTFLSLIIWFVFCVWTAERSRFLESVVLTLQIPAICVLFLVRAVARYLALIYRAYRYLINAKFTQKLLAKRVAYFQ